jgi:hypothetical protein
MFLKHFYLEPFHLGTSVYAVQKEGVAKEKAWNFREQEKFGGTYWTKNIQSTNSEYTF